MACQAMAEPFIQLTCDHLLLFMLILCVFLSQKNYKSAVVVVMHVKGTFRFEAPRQIHIAVQLPVRLKHFLTAKYQTPHAFYTIASLTLPTLFQWACVGKFSMQVIINLCNSLCIHLPFMADTCNYPWLDWETLNLTQYKYSALRYIFMYALTGQFIYNVNSLILYTPVRTLPCFQAGTECFHHFVMSMHCSQQQETNIFVLDLSCRVEHSSAR